MIMKLLGVAVAVLCALQLEAYPSYYRSSSYVRPAYGDIAYGLGHDPYHDHIPITSGIYGLSRFDRGAYYDSDPYYFRDLGYRRGRRYRPRRRYLSRRFSRRYRPRYRRGRFGLSRRRFGRRDYY